MFDVDAVRSWLTILHGEAPGYVHVCAAGNWTGGTFPTAELGRAAVYAASLDAAGTQGVYARVTTLRAPVEPGPDGRARRGGAADTLALPALWGDIDIAGPGHAEASLPPGEAEAAAVVPAAGLPEPTLWVHSGGGLYPMWLLAEPYVIEPDEGEARDAALADVADLAAGWQRALGLGARGLGWKYGTGVGDLARVLRVPGSVNRKTAQARPCRIIGGRGQRYTLDELGAALADALARNADMDDDLPREPRRLAPAPTLDIGLSPGDDYEARTDWRDILAPHGWRLVYERGGVGYWRRPGKTTPGISATTNALGTGRLRVFTTATAFEARSYGKLGALAVLEHGGDVAAAARALMARGFGTRPGAAARAAADIASIMGPTALTGTVGTSPRAPLGGAPGQGSDATGAELVAGLDDEIRYRVEVALAVRRLRVQRDARRLLDVGEWVEPPSRATLVDELAVADEPITYRVERILPTGGNAVLAAQFKSGKTTMMNELIRALADDDLFLGRYKCDMPEGRVAVFNYEVSDSQYRAWLRDLDIANPERVAVLNLRGYALPLLMAHAQDFVVRWLAERDVKVWIADPFARAITGSGDENLNSDVGVFVDMLDVIKRRAGVSELVIPTHTGREKFEPGSERARGATRLDDWADVRWLLTLDDAGRRYWRATGRDVDEPEERITFTPAGRRLTLGGHDRTGQARADMVEAVVAFVAANPGLGVNELAESMGRQRNMTTAALSAAVAAHRVMVARGPAGKRLHYPPGAWPSNGDDR